MNLPHANDCFYECTIMMDKQPAFETVTNVKATESSTLTLAQLLNRLLLQWGKTCDGERTVCVKRAAKDNWKEASLGFPCSVLEKMGYTRVLFKLTPLAPEVVETPKPTLYEKLINPQKVNATPFSSPKSWAVTANKVMENYPLQFQRDQLMCASSLFENIGRLLVQLDGSGLDSDLVTEFSGVNKAIAHRRKKKDKKKEHKAKRNKNFINPFDPQ